MLKILPPDFKFCPMCGEKLGVFEEESVERKRCPKCEWIYYPHVECGATGVEVKNGKILLVKRMREAHKNTWVLPSGFVDFGEHPSETVVREMKEETGYDAEVVRFLDVLQVDDDPRCMGLFEFFYEMRVRGEMKTADGEEISEVKWWDLDSLSNVKAHGHREILKRIGGREK